MKAIVIYYTGAEVTASQVDKIAALVPETIHIATLSEEEVANATVARPLNDVRDTLKVRKEAVKNALTVIKGYFSHLFDEPDVLSIHISKEIYGNQNDAVSKAIVILTDAGYNESWKKSHGITPAVFNVLIHISKFLK